MLRSRFAIALLLILNFYSLSLSGKSRFEVLEDFESGAVTLQSWADEDINPSGWNLDDSITYGGSSYSLKLSGNTWKQQMISPVVIDSNSVIQFAGRTQSGAKYQGIGFSDGENTIFYSISGSTVMNIEVWVPVYQGAFSHNTWNLYQLPVGADWQAFFGYLPMLTSIIYINDLDNLSNSYSVWFDDILNITSDLPKAPQVSIVTGQPTRVTGTVRDVGVQFFSQVIDPDSDVFTYRWDFGDGQSSIEANPYHLYTVTDAHPYTVSLIVRDSTGMMGIASTQVQVDTGDSTLPLTMNFVGDIMLARRYENTGGIIPTQGVNAIFTPTLPLLGAAADVTCANLEVVLSNVGTPHPTKSVVYRGSPSNISGLVYAGIDQVCLANNHTLDYGLAAQLQMQALLNDAGISYSGAGADSYEAYSPSFVNKKGINIAFLRSSDRTGQYNNAQPYLQAGFNKPGFAYMTPFYIDQQIAAVSGLADLKIVEMHGGSEYSLAPGANYDKNNPFTGDTEDEDYLHRIDVPHQWDRQIRQTAVDSGADLVIVHHPHIIQGLEIYQGKLIAHSLGNYAFDLDYPECMPTMILYVDARPEGFSNFRVKPIYIDAYIPKPATGQLAIHILDYLAMKSRELDTVFLVDREDISGEVITEPE
ncbi:MAG TPA: CapA family protein, partial [Candidatus Cloacimonadota bacterium]|nr:CapA family protein [Candidatus Cloacimonadota bacterium]